MSPSLKTSLFPEITAAPESVAQYFNLIADAPIILWMSDESRHIRYINKAWIDFTGADINQPEQRSWIFWIHPKDLKKIKQKFYTAHQNKRPVTLIYRHFYWDGSYRWVQNMCVPRFSNSGDFVGYIGSITDIEEQKKVEEQLRYQATVLENVSNIVITTDLNFIITSWNKAAEKYYEVNEAEALGKPVIQVLDCVPDEERMQARHQLLTYGIWEGETSRKNKAGEIKYFLHTVKYIHDGENKKIGFLEVGRDITEIKKAEVQLKKSEQFYRTLITASLNGTVLLDAEGTICFCAPNVTPILGFTPEEAEGKNAFEYIHPADRAYAINAFQKNLTQSPTVNFITIRLLCRDGSWSWCMVRGQNLLDNPYINSIVVYFHDDTARKQASDALKASEKRFRTLIRDLQMGVLLQDAAGNITMTNNALHRMFGIDESSILGKQIWNVLSDVIHEDGRPFDLSERPTLMAIRKKTLISNVVMGIWSPYKKERLWVLISADPIIDENDVLRNVVCSFTDITERKSLEQKLITEQISHQKQLTQATIDGQEAERREIGKELHDNIGQQLTTIKLLLDLAKNTADGVTTERIDMALKSVTSVINEIRSISHTLVPHTLKDLGLIDSIIELIDAFRRTRPVHIDFIYEDFEESILLENQKLTLFRIIQEQLNNIVKHAEASKIFIRLYCAFQNIVLEITDNGLGFDIKKVRKGLGLKNIKNRVELFGGRIEIHSQPREGCVLKVFMPVLFSCF